ncbi:MAG: hypothetical protein ACRD2D_04485, partial [Terriglobales bacterium]
DSPIGPDRRLTAMWQIVNCRNGISSCALAKNIGPGSTGAMAEALDQLEELLVSLGSGSVTK